MPTAQDRGAGYLKTCKETPFLTGTLFELFLAGVVFAGSHVVVSSTSLRPALVRILGEGPFLALYSLLRIALLGWMERAYGAAPYVEYWAAGTGHRHLAMGIMLVACLLVAAGLSPGSPLACSAPCRRRVRSASPRSRVTW